MRGFVLKSNFCSEVFIQINKTVPQIELEIPHSGVGTC